MSEVASGAAGHQEGRVGSVSKAARILAAFTPLVRMLSLRQLERRTGIPRSTAHGLCLTLCDAGLLEEAPHRGYQLGPALVALGGQVVDRTGLVDAADGVLERAVRRDGTEAHLGQLVSGWVVYLERRSGRRPVPMNNRVGMRAPAHRTGCGKAALATLPTDEVTARVCTACAADHLPMPDLDLLGRQLRRARSAGFVINTDFQPGRTSVAAPVVGRHGIVVGGVSVAGPTRLFGAAAVERTGMEIADVAATIGAKLGGAAR